VPTLHAKVVPAVRSALSGLWDVARDRHKRLELFGGNGASGAALRPRPRATCLAYGVDLNLAQLVFVNTAASVLSFLVPTPVASGPLRRASRPASSRWESTSRPPCNRHHPAPLDLRPASDLGIRVAALAQSQGLHLTASPPPNGRTEWR
jgi:hypothetical protein